MEEIEEIQDDFDHLSVPERWIFAQEIGHVSFNDETWLNNLDTFATSDPAWEDLFSGKEQDEIVEIFNQILFVIKNCIKRFDYGAFDSFIYYFHNSVCERIVKSCPRIESIIIRDELTSMDLLMMGKHCQNVVEFRIEDMEEDCDVELGIFFRTNVHLKYVEIPLGNISGACLRYLENKCMEELVVKSLSMRAAGSLLVLLQTLPSLRIFEIETPWPGRISILWGIIFQLENLQRLTLSLRTLYEVFGNWPNDFGNIIRLNLYNKNDITDGMLRIMCSELKQLRGISVADCDKVTDVGITAISTIEGIKELDISSLKITGESLKNFKTLERLNCSGSSVFDVGLCHVMSNCRDLKFLDITNCENVSSTTIRIATHVASQRQNQSILALRINLELAVKKKSPNPASLQFICECYYPGAEIMYWKFWIPCGITDDGSSLFLDVYPEEIDLQPNKRSPQMNFDCLFKILTLLPLGKRIAMERVSKVWKEVIEASWRTTKSLSFAEPDLAVMFFKKTHKKIDFIVEKLLNKVGRYLTRIELRTKCSLDIVYDNCPNLEFIDTYVNVTRQIDMEKLLNGCPTLTGLSVAFIGLQEFDFKKMFSYNRQLKYLKLHMKSNLFDLLDAVNPETLETLYVFQNTDGLHKDNTNILTKFVKLERLAMVQCSITNNIMQAIGNAQNLKYLALEQLQRDPNLNYHSILGLKNLQELCLFYCNIEDSFLIALVRRCRLISSIDLTGCDSMTDEGLGAVARLKNLHTLRINGINSVDGSGLLRLSNFGLKRLECHGCQLILSESLCYVLKNCPQLELLDVVSCRKINKKVLKTAIQVTRQRIYNIILRLIVDENFMIGDRDATKMPPLLRLFVVGNSLF